MISIMYVAREFCEWYNKGVKKNDDNSLRLDISSVSVFGHYDSATSDRVIWKWGYDRDFIYDSVYSEGNLEVTC